MEEKNKNNLQLLIIKVFKLPKNIEIDIKLEDFLLYVHKAGKILLILYVLS